MIEQLEWIDRDSEYQACRAVAHMYDLIDEPSGSIAVCEDAGRLADWAASVCYRRL